jgi:CubicO group peptidase (beta-lactamase class C family)/D-alanyl-D-alanine dipeptidase
MPDKAPFASWFTALTTCIVAIIVNCNTSAFCLAADDLNQQRSETLVNVIARVEAAVRYESAAKDLPAFSIAIVDRERLLWAAGFGYQDAGRSVLATADTIYRVGSVSKLFTDIAIMQLVESGELDIDAPVHELLPTFLPQGEGSRTITLRQLMSHRSGLVREPPVGHYFDPTEPGLKDTIASLNSTELTYHPETRVKYSNAAVSVVGAALQRHTGVSHAEHIRISLLDPLQMKRSSFVMSDDVLARLAAGWMWTYDGRRFEAPQWMLGTGPAGNMYSTVSDLANFLTFLLNDGKFDQRQILTAASLRRMTTPVIDAKGSARTFGLGFHIQDLDGHRKIGHGGAVYGFSTQVEALPERGIGVAAVCALDGSNGVVRRITDYSLRCLIAWQDGKPIPDYPTSAAVPIERASELQGQYQSDDQLADISELNGRTFLRNGSYRRELRSRSEDGAVVTNDVLGGGTVVRLESTNELMVGNTSFDRRADEPPANPPASWRGLIGEYGWDHNTLYILEEHGKLTALIEWFYYYPLTPLGDDEFAFPDYGLYHGEKLKFERDGSGTATRVVAAEVVFERREVGTKDGETFRITPVRPVAELRNGALSASPPVEIGQFRKPDLVQLTALDPSIKLDIRYASTNNFTGSIFYKQPRAFMQRPAAEAVDRVHQKLKTRGLGLLIHDAYRPWHVTKMFWDATPDEMKAFVADPSKGSRHNRGCAVDLTLFDLKTGEPIQMVAGYDEFSERSFPAYPGGTTRQRWYRTLLRNEMEAEGFSVYEFEWWHFDYKDWRSYRIGNKTFEDILETNAATENGQSNLPFRVDRSVVPVTVDGVPDSYDAQHCWVHARVGAIPQQDARIPQVVLTTQQLQLTGSDVFFELNSTHTNNLGATWANMTPQPPFIRKVIDEHTEMTVCDFVPQWHAASNTLLGIGQTVWYRDNKVMSFRPRATAWSVYDPGNAAWSAWQELKMPNQPRFRNCGAGSVQRVDLPNGDILLPVYFKAESAKQYSVTVCRCRFDGKHLTYVEHGDELTIPVKRGLYEPSLTFCCGQYLLTIRNDDHGYVTRSSDGLHFDQPKRWAFDDGSDLGNYNTQQHWVTHKDELYLVYTRRAADNDHVFRHRAPLFIARVDPQKLVVERHTEQILIPERGARLGNFGVSRISADEIWVTVTEWMQAPRPNLVIPVDNSRGANNAIHIAKLKW